MEPIVEKRPYETPELVEVVSAREGVEVIGSGQIP